MRTPKGQGQATASSALSVAISLVRSEDGESMPEENHRPHPAAREKCVRRHLSCTLRAECVNRVTPVDPIEHVGELRGRDRDAAAFGGGSNEAAALQPLGIERQA